MPNKIKFTTVASNKSFIRPTGYTFPAGLTQLVVANTSVDYLVVAGGGGGTRGG